MRKLIFVLAGAFCGFAASAQDLLDCVNPDVLRGLVLRSSADEGVVFSTASPAQMSDITAPPQFDWIGSVERTGGVAASVSAAFRTDLAPDAAMEVAMAGLTSSGWEAQPQLGGAGGAFASMPITRSQTACRDEQPVSVAANELENTTYVTYSFTTSSANTVCSAPDPSSPLGGLSANIYRDMPSLEFPPDPVTGEPVRSSGGGGGGSQNVRYSTTQVTHNESLNGLAVFLSEQLSAQGWVADTSWTGTTTAGSSWTRQADPDASLQGMLQITALANSRYDVTFRIVTLQ
jgi:hypothetical protein